MTTQQCQKIETAKLSPDTSDALKRAVEGLEEIEILSRHPNSDARVHDWALLTLSNIADALPD